MGLREGLEWRWEIQFKRQYGNSHMTTIESISHNLPDSQANLDSGQKECIVSRDLQAHLRQTRG